MLLNTLFFGGAKVEIIKNNTTQNQNYIFCKLKSCLIVIGFNKFAQTIA